MPFGSETKPVITEWILSNKGTIENIDEQAKAIRKEAKAERDLMLVAKKLGFEFGKNEKALKKETAALKEQEKAAKARLKIDKALEAAIKKNAAARARALKEQEAAAKRTATTWTELKSKYSVVTGVVGKLYRMFDRAMSQGTRLNKMYDAQTLSITAATRATEGFLSQSELLRAANLSQTMKLDLTSEQFARMSRNAVIAADIIGGDVPNAINDLMVGLSRQSKQILDNLGIQVSATKAQADYAKQLGVTTAALTEADKKQAFINAALKDLERIAAASNLEIKTSGDAWRVLENSQDDAQAAFVRWIAEATVGKELLTDIATLARDAAAALYIDPFQRQKQELRELGFDVEETITKTGHIELKLLRKTADGMKEVTADLLNWGTQRSNIWAKDKGKTWRRAYKIFTEYHANAVRQQVNLYKKSATEFDKMVAGMEKRAQKFYRTTPRTGAERRALRRFRDEQAKAYAATAPGNADVRAAERKARKKKRASRRAPTIEGGAGFMMGGLVPGGDGGLGLGMGAGAAGALTPEGPSPYAQAAIDMLKLTDATQKKIDADIGAEAAARRHAVAMSELKLEVTDMATGALAQFASGMWAAADAAIMGEESMGMALAKMLKTTLLGIAAEATARAVLELGLGFAAQAATSGVPNPKSILHFTSAAILGGIGAVTGVAGLAVSAGISAAGGYDKKTSGSTTKAKTSSTPSYQSFGDRKKESDKPLHVHLYLGAPGNKAAARLAAYQLGGVMQEAA